VAQPGRDSMLPCVSPPLHFSATAIVQKQDEVGPMDAALHAAPIPTITIRRYGLPRFDYARTLSNPDGTAMLINKRRFSGTLGSILSGEGFDSGTRRIAVLTFSVIQVSRGIEKIVVKPAKSSTNVFHFAVPRLAAEEQLERWTLRGRMTGSTVHQDVLGLMHALQLGVGSAVIVLTIVLSCQR
jgi:hypothetical protein